MLTLTINGEPRTLPNPLTLSELLHQLGYDRRRIAVEVNRQVVPLPRHDNHRLAPGDDVEIVTLVGGGSGGDTEARRHPDTESPRQDAGTRRRGDTENLTPADPRVPASPHPRVLDSLAVSPRPPVSASPLKIGSFTFQSRLITGTGKYATYDQMRECLAASGCEVTTVAVRRERLLDKEGRNILDFLDLKHYTILPNTAGCFSAEDAIRHARLARELLSNLGNEGADWVKLECLGDRKTLLPDPVATLAATEQLVKERFQVLVYTSDDPIMARRLKEAGAASVMPAGSPIGSGQGVLNPNNIRIILEYLKDGDPDYPVIVDAGVGTASDVTVAMELGCDGVLLNTGIAAAREPLQMAHAMRHACEAGRLAFLAGRIPKKLYAQASSPMEGRIGQNS